MDRAKAWLSASAGSGSSLSPKTANYVAIPTTSVSRRDQLSLGSSDSFIAPVTHRSPFRPTVLLLFGVVLFATIAIDRRIVRFRNLRNEQFLFTNWSNRPIDPLVGSERSDLASLVSVCNAPAVQGGNQLPEGKVDVGMDRLMNEGTCQTVFPSLYKELDRVVQYYKQRGPVQMWELGVQCFGNQAKQLGLLTT